MAQQRQFYNPKKSSRGVYDSEEQSTIPAAPSSLNQSASQGAQNTLNDIDSLLAEQENNRSTPASSDQTSAPANKGAIAEQENQGEDSEPAGDNEEGSANEAGSTGGSSSNDKKGKSTFSAKSFAKRHVKKLAAGAAVGMFLTISAFIIIPALGPLQLMHLSHILQRSMEKGYADNTVRMGKLFGYSRAVKTGDVGETRVGVLGSRVFHRTVVQLSAMGIDIERSGSGAPVRTTIDTDKLSAKYPELAGMNESQKKAFLSDKLGLKAGQLTGSGSKFSVDQTDMNVRASRLLLQSSLRLVNGRIVTAIKMRPLAKFLNIPSLWHPLKRFISGKENSYIARVTADEQKKREVERRNTLMEPSKTAATASIKNVRESSAKFNSVAMKALLVTGGACFVHEVAGDVIIINRERIVIPAVIEAMDKMAVGEQLESGYDATAAQAGGVLASLEDKDGKSIWDAKALNALANDGTDKGGPDISMDYQQAFSADTTAANIQGWADSVLLGSASAACSKVGLAIQAALSIGAAALSLVGAVGSAGTLTPAIAAFWAGKQALSFVISAAVMQFATNLIINATTEEILTEAAFQGVSGGNMLAYGAREGANMAARSSGGVDLGNKESTYVWTEQHEADLKDFQSKSLYARIFDTRDYRSLTGRLADSVNLSWRGNLMASINGVFFQNHSLTNLFAPLMPKAFAAEAPAYNWAFSQVGLPQSMLDDPDLDDPYANADKIVPLLNGDGQKYIDRAKDCFGVTIAKNGDGLWDSNPTDDVNPASVEYTDAKCAEVSDSQDPDKNWRRMIMFVFDTTTMKAVACYDGDDTACREVAGKTSTPAAPAAGAGGTAIPTGDTIALAKQILADPNITFQTADRKNEFQIIADTGKATQCGAPTISPKLLGVILTLAKSYKLVLGYVTDNHGCDRGQHPKGTAIDINGVNPLNGGVGTGTNIRFEPAELPILRQFYKSAGDVLAANGGGALGQHEYFPGGAPEVPGVVYFNDDTPNHLHLDAR